MKDLGNDYRDMHRYANSLKKYEECWKEMKHDIRHNKILYDTMRHYESWYDKKFGPR